MADPSPTESVRAFIALPLPKSVVDELKGLQQKLAPSNVFHASGEDTIHLTLYFLGSVSPETLAEIQDRLRRIEMEPFRLRLGDVVHLPKPDVPRVVAVGLKGDTSVLTRLQRRVQDSVFQLDVFKETRTYLPHITFARLKKDVPASAKPVKRALASLGKPKDVEWSVQGFTLFTSVTGPEGVVHEPLVTYPD